MKNLLLLLLVFLQSEIGLSMAINGPLVRAGLENQASDPSTTLTGRVYWNTTNAKARIWDGSAWQDFGTGGGASAAYTITPTAVTAVGGAFSPAGHTLDSNDFPVTTGKIAFWNLSSASDNSGALSCASSTACDLTNNGTVTFTSTGIGGVSSTAASFNGTTQSLSKSDAFLKVATTDSYLIGGWFAPTDWTPSAVQNLLGLEYDTSTNRGAYISLNTDGVLFFTDYSDATSAGQAVVTATAPGYTDGDWHHVAIGYNATTHVLSGYLDGKEVGHVSLTKTATAASQIFRIGARSNTAVNFYSGLADEFFFWKNTTSPNGDDIRKLAARRFDHNLAIGSESQLWLGTWQRSDQAVAVNLDGFLVSKDTNHAWLDFSGAATGAYVSAKMLNTQSSLTSVPQGSYDSGYLSSTPITTIPHGLGDVPAMIVVYYETSTNKFTPLTGSNFCESDATNLYCDWTGLTVAAGSRVRIQAWATGSMSAVPAASAAQSGVVNTTSQTFAGAKTFSGGIVGKSDGVAVAAGMVGERKSATENASTATATSATIVWADATNSLSLEAGVWEIHYFDSTNRGSITGTSVTGFAHARIYNSTDSTSVAEQLHVSYSGNTSDPEAMYAGAFHVSEVVNIGSTKVYKGQIGASTNSGTSPSMGFATRGTGRFYALRVAP